MPGYINDSFINKRKNRICHVIYASENEEILRKNGMNMVVARLTQVSTLNLSVSTKSRQSRISQRKHYINFLTLVYRG